jgi:deoxyribose-phosphate aldolase
MLDKIEYTLLRPNASQSDFEKLVETAMEFKVVGVCLPPWWVKVARRNLGHSGTRLVTVVGFPFGYQKTKVKLDEVNDVLEDGADEVDIVMNISAFKTGMLSWVKPELARAAQMCHEGERFLKVILETAYLSDEEIITASKMCLDAGVDFIKTSTGYAPEGAKVEIIELIRKTVGHQALIKASGGIKTKEFAELLISAGADRIGTSSHPTVFLD